MVPMFSYAGLVPHVAALLAYLVGLAVAIILLVRAKGRAAILAAVGFASLILVSIGQIVLALPSVNVQFVRAGQWLAWVLNCCCSMFDVAAIACLIVAIWQAVSGAGTEEVEEVIVDVSEEAPEAAYATAKLEDAPEGDTEEALEGEILEDNPSGSPYVTKVLRETPEEAADTLGEVVEESE